MGSQRSDSAGEERKGRLSSNPKERSYCTRRRWSIPALAVASARQWLSTFRWFGAIRQVSRLGSYAAASRLNPEDLNLLVVPASGAAPRGAGACDGAQSAVARRSGIMVLQVSSRPSSLTP